MRLYRYLLFLYPTAFRNEYGREMTWIFSQRLRTTSGLFPALLLWLGTFCEIFWNALQSHLDILRQDLRAAVRGFVRSPGFVITAVLVTTLGVGANTAVFSILDHVLIGPLPYADSDRLVKIWEKTPGYSHTEPSPPNYRDWKTMSGSFESMEAHTWVSMNLMADGYPERVEGAMVTADLLPMLGMRPILGRWFDKADDQVSAAGTVLLSHALWQSRFNGRYDIVGHRLQLNNEAFTIIGVMPPTFHYPARETRFWIPIRLGESDYEDRGNKYLYVLAKLKPGVSLENARAEMDVISRRLEQQYPEENDQTSATVEHIRGGISRQSRMILAVLAAASLCVLLIACTNIAGLFLVRAMGRVKELSVRTALGAGRERLIRLLLTESLLIAAIGGVLGLVVAYSSLPLLERLVPASLPLGEATVLNVRVFGFAAFLVCVTGVTFGVGPAIRVFKKADITGLREGSRAGLGGKRERVRSVLVISEVMVSVVLLIAAGLLMRALWRIQMTDPGFRAESVLTLQTPLTETRYKEIHKRASFYSRVLSEVRSQPGVSDASYISFLPMVMGGGIRPVEIPGRAANADTDRASFRFITADFFRTMRIPLQRGRDVSESDTQTAPYVAVVSESFARNYWPGENPIGRTMKIAFQERTIVGVVGDIRVRGLERSSEPQVYVPHQQVPDGAIIRYWPKALVVRSTIEPELLATRIREIVSKTDPEIPVTEVRTLEDVVTADTASRRTQITVIWIFAALAMLLSGIGIHGLLASAVSQKTPEIGLRIALGAKKSDILRMVLQSALRVAIAGGVLGILIAYGAGRWMQSLLAGISPSDALTFAVATLLALLTTVSGCLAPAIRAVRVDPATVMRVE